MTEYLDVVDENDKVIAKATRKECHSDSGLIHRGVFIAIFDSAGKLLLQKRSMKKDLNPGKWVISSSGHVDSGDNYEKAARRELLEELGIKKKLKFLFDFDNYSVQQREKMRAFTIQYDGSFKIDHKEVEYVKFFKIEEIKNMIDKNKDDFTPGFLKFFKKYLKISKKNSKS